MTLLHVMTLSGSIAVIIYLLLFGFTKKHMSMAWHKVYLTITIFLYIVPFQWFSPEYTAWLQKYLGLYLKRNKTANVLIDISGSTIAVFNNIIYVNNLWLYIFIIASISLSIYMMAVHIKRYRKLYSGIMNDSVKNKMVQEVLKEFCKNEDINIKAEVYICDDLKTPVTIGIFHRKIILPNEEWSRENLKDVFCHEIIHIRFMDNLVKMLLLLVVILNFYNPLVYYLFYRWSLTSEMYCDEKVIAYKSSKEIRDYANLLIDFAEGKDNINQPVLGLNMDKRQMKERIMNMKRTNKKKGVVSKAVGMVIIAAAVFTSSLTAFAYEEKQIVQLDEKYDGSKKDISFVDEESIVQCQPNSEFKEYDAYVNSENMSVFIDEAGEIYYINNEDEITPYAFCIHNYVSGTFMIHSKKSDGSCYTDYYSGKRCDKCGDIILGDYINTSSFAKCPH